MSINGVYFSVGSLLCIFGVVAFMIFMFATIAEIRGQGIVILEPDEENDEGDEDVPHETDEANE